MNQLLDPPVEPRLFNRAQRFGVQGRKSARFGWPILICVILALIAPLIGVAILKGHAPDAARKAQIELAAIADLKASQIENWIQERHNDAALITSAPGFIEQVMALQQGGSSAQDDLRARLLAAARALNYGAAWITDAQGRQLVGIDPSPALASVMTELVPQSLLASRTAWNMAFVEEKGERHLDLVIPLRLHEKSGRSPIGALVLRVKPERFLLPYVEYWPTASPSGETLLVRRDGDMVEFINEPRHRRAAGAPRRLPMSREELPAVVAINAAQPGVVQSRDYRGVTVLGAYRPIPGTDWHIVAKLDHDEVLAPVRAMAFWIGLIAMLVLGAVAVIVFLLWRQRLRSLSLESQMQLDGLLKQFYELPFIGIAISSPTTKHWLRFNDRLCEILGRSREEMSQATWDEMTHPDDLAADVEQFERLMQGESEGYSLDKRFVRKDGSTVHVTLDVRCSRRADGSAEHIFATVQDISERKQAEVKIERLMRTYATLSECNQAIVRCASAEELFAKICDVAVHQGGMQMAWVGLLDPETLRVKPVASCGDATNHLADAMISADASSPYGQGVTGVAIRERRPDWIQDYNTDPRTVPWQERALRAGWNATGALPLILDDRVIGAFVLNASEAHAFDETIRNLLAEMAIDISFALSTFEREKERRLAEAQVARLTRMYAALSECNQAIVRCSSAEELFPKVCRFAVEFGGMKMAWIGWIDPETLLIRPAACFGEGTEVLRDIVISTDADSPLGQGAAGKAVRELNPFWVQDYLNDPMTAPWHEQGRRFGWRASAVLPLTKNNAAVGAFVLLSGEKDGFDEAVRNLLVEMAMDISFALTTFSREQERLHMHDALRESESRFRELYEKAPLAYQSLDVNGNIIEVNEAWLTLLGRTREEVIGRFVGDFLTQTSLKALPEKLANLQHQEGSESPLFQFVRKDGECRLVMANARMSRGSDGEFKIIHCILSDLTERMRTEEQLHLTSKVFEQGGEGVMITDDQAHILMVNRAFEMITGYTQEEVIGKNPRFLSSGRHDREFFRTMWETIKSAGFWQGEIWNRRKDGGVFPEYLTLSRIVDEHGRTTHYIATFNDISESKASQEHIQRLAHYDSLTGLPNRMLLADRVDLALSRMERNGEQLALIFLDLDRFKNVNDSLGHRIGDELLIRVAERLKEILREEDTVSRLGGDEFIMVLPSTDADGASHVAGKVLTDLSRPYHIEQYELSITPSMGIAMYPADGTSYEALSMCADTAMYRAKQGGRQTFRFFTREMQERSDRTLQLENALRRALELNQLRLNYQPQVSLENGRVIGVEALLRWYHPDLGEVGPSDFIPVAEDSGLILPIGEWVLRSAVRQMRAWIDGGLPPMVMAVNLSAIQFRQPNLPQLVSQILADAHLPPNLLELELTEGVAMENPVEAIEIMNELHGLGVRMSIDDFGTGYSSLSYLKRFKVYKLKVDRSFVQDISMDPDDEAIVEGIIGMSRSLGLKTIAEGVETEEQSAFLRAKGCHEAQGFLFSRPVAADEFENFVRTSWSKTRDRS